MQARCSTLSTRTQMLVQSVPPSRSARTCFTNRSTRSGVGDGSSLQAYDTHSLFGGRRVVSAKAVNIEVRKGQTLGIVEVWVWQVDGRALYDRLIETTDGRIMLSGTDIAKLPARQLREMRRKVQIISNPTGPLNPRRTIGDSIIEGPMNYGASRSGR